MEPTLKVGWYGGALGTAFQSAVVDPFQKATGVKVTVESGFDNARLTQLKAQPGALDVAFFTAPVMPDVRSAGIATPLSNATIPQLNDVYDNLKSPSASAPDSFAWSFGVWGIAYNADKVKTAPTSWADLLNPAYKDHITAPDISFNSSILTLVAFAKLGGGSLDNLQPGFDRMKQLRQNSPFFWPSDAQMLQGLQQGTIWLSPYANGGTYQAAKQPGAPPIKFALPKEGGYLVPFYFVIPKGAQSPHAAAAFGNFLLNPSVQADWAAKTFYSPANKNASIPASVQGDILTGSAVGQLQDIDWAKFAKIRPQVVQEWQQTIH